VYKRNTALLSRNHCYSRKAVIITYREWVSLAFVINQAILMLHVISVARLVVPFFPPQSFHEWHFFCRQVIEN